MPEPTLSDAGSQPVPLAFMGLAIGLMGGIWVLLVGGVHRAEMIVGAASVVIATFILWLVARVRHQKMQFKARDVMTGWRLPWYAAQDVAIVSRVLVRDLLLRVPPSSAYRVCGFRTSKRQPEDVARRVLVTGYTSATPNVIVIGVDYAQSRILFHQLEPAGLNRTMRELGALR